MAISRLGDRSPPPRIDLGTGRRAEIRAMHGVAGSPRHRQHRGDMAPWGPIAKGSRTHGEMRPRRHGAASPWRSRALGPRRRVVLSPNRPGASGPRGGTAFPLRTVGEQWKGRRAAGSHSGWPFPLTQWKAQWKGGPPRPCWRHGTRPRILLDVERLGGHILSGVALVDLVRHCCGIASSFHGFIPDLLHAAAHSWTMGLAWARRGHGLNPPPT